MPLFFGLIFFVKHDILSVTSVNKTVNYFFQSIRAFVWGFGTSGHPWRCTKTPQWTTPNEIKTVSRWRFGGSCLEPQPERVLVSLTNHHYIVFLSRLLKCFLIAQRELMILGIIANTIPNHQAMGWECSLVAHIWILTNKHQHFIWTKWLGCLCCCKTVPQNYGLYRNWSFYKIYGSHLVRPQKS